MVALLTACTIKPVVPGNSASNVVSNSNIQGNGSGSSSPSDTPNDNPNVGTESTEPKHNLPGTIDAQALCAHVFNNDVCKKCSTRENPFVFSVFGDNVVIYNNQTENPYDVDLDVYGSDVQAVFYTPNFDGIEDAYTDSTKDNFYTDGYTEAWCYEDSYYRTRHFLLSGDMTEQSHLPTSHPIVRDDTLVEITTATYVLSPAGSFLGYVVYNPWGGAEIIYYGAGYASLEEVAAYLLAFGEAPPNSNYKKSSTGKKQSIADWGVYGRVNVGNFRNNGSSTEPLLPGTTYLETDFGTRGGFYVGDGIVDAYNNGSSITRGTARFVFTPITAQKSIDDRYVFYTYNHYNDFQQYLNYKGGWGLRFGNESAGNKYNQGGNTPTTYPQVTLFSYYDLLS